MKRIFLIALISILVVAAVVSAQMMQIDKRPVKILDVTMKNAYEIGFKIENTSGYPITEIAMVFLLHDHDGYRVEPLEADCRDAPLQPNAKMKLNFEFENGTTIPFWMFALIIMKQDGVYYHWENPNLDKILNWTN